MDRLGRDVAGVRSAAKAAHRSGLARGRQRARARVVAAAWLALAPTLPGQEPLTALQILERAIAAQGLAEPPPERMDRLALHVRASLRHKTPQGDDVAVEAERRFLAPDRIVTQAVSTFDRSETRSGFDGERPWVWTRKGGTRWLDQPGFETDRRQIERDLETTALLTRAFALRNLPGALTDLRRLEDASAHGVTAWVIEGDAKIEREGASKPLRLRLWIEQKSGWLFGARVEIEGDPPLQICCTRHEVRDGVVVPGRIELYWNDEATAQQTIYVTHLDLDPKLADSDFRPPD